jgi:uncharacterized membrane protein
VSKQLMTMSGATQQYLRRLADGLDALSSSDRAEVVAEISGHIADATAEAGGDESQALAAFGNPEDLAARILAERGIIAESRGLQAAPAWMRWGALIFDAGQWLLLLVLGLAVPLALVAVVAYSSRVIAVPAWLFVAVILGVTVWWWGWKRRRRGFTSSGMSIIGIRRVRVTGTTKLVRATDLGEPSRTKGELAGSIVWAAIVLVLLGFLLYGWAAGWAQNSTYARQQTVQSAVQDTLEAERVIDSMYKAAMKGESVYTWFGPQTAAVGTELLARYNAASFDDFNVDNVQFPDYRSMPDGKDLAGYTLTAVIDVTEISDGSSSAAYEYTIVKRVTDVQYSRRGANSTLNYSAEWRVESVTKLDG